MTTREQFNEKTDEERLTLLNVVEKDLERTNALCSLLKQENEKMEIQIKIIKQVLSL